MTSKAQYTSYFADMQMLIFSSLFLLYRNYAIKHYATV